jgi:predicted transcriptional regulator
VTTDEGADDLLELLGEQRVREILAATSHEPLSASELSEECDVALSTIYRRVEDMLAHDMLVERTRIEADGSHHALYEAKLDRAVVDIDDGAIEVQVAVREDAAQRFTRIWSDIRRT